MQESKKSQVFSDCHMHCAFQHGWWTALDTSTMDLRIRIDQSRRILRSVGLGMALLSLAAGGCKEGSESARATAQLHDPQGKPIGTVKLQELEEGVLLTLEIDALPPGEHAVHVHEVGECTAPSFESAGEHLAFNGARHGLADEGFKGAHAGDLVDLVVDDAGMARTHRVVIGATLDRDAPSGSKSLLRAGGTAIVIHADRDDYRTEPAGASGDRIACGVITAAAAK